MLNRRRVRLVESDCYDYMEFQEAVEGITPEEQAWIEAVPSYDDFQAAQKPLETVDNLASLDALFRAFLQKHDICVSGTRFLPHHWRYFPAFNSRVEDETWWVEASGRALTQHVATVVQAFLKKFRPNTAFLLTWGQRNDERDESILTRRIGGGWLMVTKNKIVEQDVWKAAHNAYEEHRDDLLREKHKGVGKVVDDAPG